jgi:hypothetical protein
MINRGDTEIAENIIRFKTGGLWCFIAMSSTPRKRVGLIRINPIAFLKFMI